MIPFWTAFWPILIGLVHTGLVVVSTLHILMHKRETRAAIGWAGLVWLAPLIGSILYFCFGINRIQRKAMRLQVQSAWQPRSPVAQEEPREVTAQAVDRIFPNLSGLSHLVEAVTGSPLLSGNAILPLNNGDEAFPRMLAAIDRAEHSVTLLSYIFDADDVGKRFVEALRRAHQRGVEVRVLVDDVGSRYSNPTIVHLLREQQIPTTTFLPSRTPRLVPYANLRNHRKILVVDGRVGFTGGTNIRAGHWLAHQPKWPVQCLHFELRGPVVQQLQATFAIDWAFASGESLSGDRWFPDVVPESDIWARGISDGPDEDFEILHDTLLGAITSAQDSIRIVTPYFLPELPLIHALNVAALRNVDVRIYLPQKNNIPIVDWASRAILPQLLEKGCRFFETPPPFDHTKLMVVDQTWSLIGSTNWDPRSLRLNFEFNVECYSEHLATVLTQIVEQKGKASREITLEDLMNRHVIWRLRDNLCRLATPYL